MATRTPAAIIGRPLGWGLVALALLALGAELLASLEAGDYVALTAGEVWYAIDPASLNLVQAVVQRYLHPALWDPVATAILLRPAWLVLGLPGAALAYIFRTRRPRRWFSSS